MDWEAREGGRSGSGGRSGEWEWEWGVEVEWKWKWKWKSGHRIDAVTMMVLLGICLSCLHTQEASGVGCLPRISWCGAAALAAQRPSRRVDGGDRLLFP